MRYDEFSDQMRRLKLTYGERVFPEEREKMFFKKYEKFPVKVFEEAVDWVVFNMPQAANVTKSLDDQLQGFYQATGGRRLGAAEMDILHPMQPNAAELAAKYAPGIIEMLRRGPLAELPYDKNERIEGE